VGPQRQRLSIPLFHELCHCEIERIFGAAKRASGLEINHESRRSIPGNTLFLFEKNTVYRADRCNYATAFD